MTPLDALGLFVGIPVVIITLVVGAVYGARAMGFGPQVRAGVLPPLTEPVLGNPDQPSRRLDRERQEAEARRTGAAAAPDAALRAEDAAAGSVSAEPGEQEKRDSAE